MQVSPHCFAITGLGYVPPWAVNAGFVIGENTTLVVDAGANALAAATIHGYALAARPGNRLLLVNTERHFDHVGGNGYFRERGIDVLAHPASARTADEFRAEIEEYNSSIPDPARRTAGEAAAFYVGTTLANANRHITEDTVLDLGGVRVEILMTPGHTPSNLSVWVPDDRVVFCGDTVVNGYEPNLGSASPRDWLRSLDHIVKLDPKVIVPGHGPVVRRPEIATVMARVTGAIR